MVKAEPKTFLCSYTFQGARWQFEILADSFTDARERVQAIRLSGLVDGEAMANIPVPSFVDRVLRWLHD
jgi:hypothetical protein